MLWTSILRVFSNLNATCPYLWESIIIFWGPFYPCSPPWSLSGLPVNCMKISEFPFAQQSVRESDLSVALACHADPMVPDSILSVTWMLLHATDALASKAFANNLQCCCLSPKPHSQFTQFLQSELMLEGWGHSLLETVQAAQGLVLLQRNEGSGVEPRHACLLVPPCTCYALLLAILGTLSPKP